MRPFDPLNLLAAKWRMWLHGHGRLEAHTAEQIAYRQSLCPDCMAAGYCLGCGCPVPAKFYQTGQCSFQRWPRLMPWDQWRAWHKDNTLAKEAPPMKDIIVQGNVSDDTDFRAAIAQSLDETEW